MSKNSIIDNQVELKERQLEAFYSIFLFSEPFLKKQESKINFIEGKEWIDLQKSNRPLMKKKYEI